MWWAPDYEPLTEDEQNYRELSSEEEAKITEYIRECLDSSMGGAFDPDERMIVYEMLESGEYDHVDPEILDEIYDSVLSEFESRLDDAEHVVWNTSEGVWGCTGCAILLGKDEENFQILSHREGSAVTEVIGEISQKEFNAMSKADKGRYILSHLNDAFHRLDSWENGEYYVEWEYFTPEVVHEAFVAIGAIPTPDNTYIIRPERTPREALDRVAAARQKALERKAQE